MRTALARRRRVLISVGVGALLLLVLTWFDTNVLVAARRDAQANLGNTLLITTLGIFGMAGGIMALGGLAWWARSAITGLVYAIVGAIFVVVPVILFSNPSSLPDPLTRALTDFFVATSGPLNASVVVGAGMFLAGLVAFYRVWIASSDAEPAPTSAVPARKSGRP